MVAISNILCPVDFSPFSRNALQHGAQLAGWFQATLSVVYVYPPPAAPPPVLFGGLPGPVDIEPLPALTVSPERLHDDMTARLTTFTTSVDLSRVQTRLHARPGRAVEGILDEAAATPCNLIVLGTHGHSGLDRLALGSVTEKVLRKARCPVLTVPPSVGETPGEALYIFKRILCAVDFSEASLKALEYALALAKEADAELVLLHVIEGMADVQHWQQPTNPSILEYLRLSEQHALAQLRQVVPQDAHVWCKPKEVLLTGKPYREILRVAHDEDVHLIVMGVHGRNPVDLMFFGSTTNHVVRTATCPVLTLKS
jgi:nucleotide-binding universal stress UspA family protein